MKYILCSQATYIQLTSFLYCSIQSLDRGGAITGRPSGRQQQQQQLQKRVESPLPSNTSSSVSGDTGTSIKKKILNTLNVGYAITGPPTTQPSNR